MDAMAYLEQRLAQVTAERDAAVQALVLLRQGHEAALALISAVVVTDKAASEREAALTVDAERAGRLAHARQLLEKP